MKIVFIVGLSEGVFPSYMSLRSNDLREEMRTFYVALTRAKKNLYLSYYKYEEYYNRCNKLSRFIENMDKMYIEYNHLI